MIYVPAPRFRLPDLRKDIAAAVATGLLMVVMTVAVVAVMP